MNALVTFLSLLNLFFVGVQSDATLSPQPPPIESPVIQDQLLSGDTISIIKFGAVSPLHKTYKSISFNGKSFGQLDEMLNSYLADGDTYLVSDDHTVYAFDDKDINSEKAMGEKSYSQNELEDMAKALLSEGTKVNIDTLTPAHGNKGDNYFFRWEDTSKKIFDGSFNAFIQVGIRKDGWIFSYTYALPY